MKALVALALAMACAAAAPAAEQRRNDVLALEAMQNYAKCVIDRNKKGAEKLLAMDFRTSEYRKAMRTYAKGHDYCVWRGKLKFSPVIFAGELSETLLVKGGLARDLGGAIEAHPGAATVMARGRLEDAALCVVRKEPGKVGALMTTPVASEAEDGAMRALGGTLVGCVPAGVNVRLNRPGLRAMLAIAAYRLTHENSTAGNG